MNARPIRCCAMALLVALASPNVVRAADPAKPASAAKPSPGQIARGRYLVNIGNCNDCHTQDFGPRDGNVPESEWLKGSSMGNAGTAIVGVIRRSRVSKNCWTRCH